MDITLIAAVAANGVIGADGDIPWHLPQDLQHFKETTTGHPVIMGRRTYDSIRNRLDGPLPDRTNIVLSSRSLETSPSVEHVQSVDAAVTRAEATGTETAYVIGGASVYEQFLPRADWLLLTELHEAYAGDTYFPEWDSTTWTEVTRTEYADFDIVKYTRDSSTNTC